MLVRDEVKADGIEAVVEDGGISMFYIDMADGQRAEGVV